MKDKRINMRVPEELHERIKKQADKENRSLTNFILNAVEKELNKSEGEKKMTKTRKLRNFEVEVDEATGKVESIVKNSSDGRTAVYPYKYEEKYGASVRIDNINFNSLKTGVYTGRIDLM
ncbi:YlcI/YnfO family protein [Lagierella sp. ICN-221743]